MSLPHVVVTGTAHSTRDGVTARDGREQKPNQEEGEKRQGRCGSVLLFAFFSAAEIELRICLPFPAAEAS